MTQKEIANTLNISVATVSLSLRDCPKIKKETREKVKKLASLLKYRPNLTARNLLTGKTFSVGVVLPPFSEPFYGELVSEIQHQLHDRNYIGIFFPTQTPQEYREAVETLLSRKIDGLISKPVSVEEILMLRDEKIPTVYFEEQAIPVDYAGVDRYKGGSMATSHLISLGHKKVGFIGLAEENEKRFLGYRDTLYRHKLPVRKEWIAHGLGYRETGYKGMKKILQSRDTPTAIFAHNDAVAIGAMRAIYEAGLKVPEDIAIVGFDNLEEAKYANVSLTTVEQSRKEIAENLVRILLRKMENPNARALQQVLLEPKLIIRESCGFCLTKQKQ